MVSMEHCGGDGFLLSYSVGLIKTIAGDYNEEVRARHAHPGSYT
jgi:hypothetical protein